MGFLKPNFKRVSADLCAAVFQHDPADNSENCKWNCTMCATNIKRCFNLVIFILFGSKESLWRLPRLTVLLWTESQFCVTAVDLLKAFAAADIH